jgi:hypothetical protein
MNRIVVLLVVLLCASSGFAQKVRMDYDHGRDFSKYKTYSWREAQPTEPPDVQFPSQLMRERIVAFVQEELAAKHLTRVQRGGDLLVDYDMEVSAQPQFTTYTDAFGPSFVWGGWGSGFAWGGGLNSAFSQTTTQIILSGTLVVNMTDSHQRQLVFQGTSTDNISSKAEKNTKRLQRGICKMFAWYPPR